MIEDVMTFLPKPERGQVVSRSRACLAAKDASLCLRAARHPLAAPPVGLMGGHRLVLGAVTPAAPSVGLGRLNWDQKIPLLDGNSLDRYIVHCAENGYRKVRMLGFGESRGSPQQITRISVAGASKGVRR